MTDKAGWWHEAVGAIVAAGLLGLPPFWWSKRSDLFALPLLVLWVLLVGVVLYQPLRGRLRIPSFTLRSGIRWAAPLFGVWLAVQGTAALLGVPWFNALVTRSVPAWAIAVAFGTGLLLALLPQLVARRAHLPADAPRVIVMFDGPGVGRGLPESLGVANESDSVALNVRLSPFVRLGQTIDFPAVDVLKAHQRQPLDLGGIRLYVLLEQEPAETTTTEADLVRSLKEYARPVPVQLEAHYGSADRRRYRSILRFRYDRITHKATAKEAWVELAGDAWRMSD